jgi:TRAP-type mannitol/chloroaromatic compound transport system permease small subunit
MTKSLAVLVAKLDGITARIGRATAWTSVLMLLSMFLVVVLRHVFNLGSIALQESITYLHATLFICVSAYTLGNNGHVRVDVFYRGFSERQKAWVNLFGVLCLLFPVMGVLGWYSIDYVANSWRIGEGSREAGGIPALYLMKSLILVFVLLFFIQGISELLRNLLILLDKETILYKKDSQGGVL